MATRLLKLIAVSLFTLALTAPAALAETASTVPSGPTESARVDHYFCSFNPDQFCDYVLIGQSEYVVCGLPDNPRSMNVDFFFDFAPELCVYLGSETVTDPAKLIDLVRTVNADNPVKQIIPQEQRNQIKKGLKGLFGIE